MTRPTVLEMFVIIFILFLLNALSNVVLLFVYILAVQTSAKD